MAQRKRKKTSSRKKSATRRKTSSRKKSSSRKKRKYSRSAGSDVRKEMHEYERGEARSGRSGRKVKSRKQAIAIGLSKARRKGKRVPPNPNRGKRS